KNCSSCTRHNEIGIYYYLNKFNKSVNDNEFNKLVNEIEDLSNKLEKEEQKEGEKGNMIVDLGDKLIYIDNELNGSILCEGCKRKNTINKLSNILNESINKSCLTVSVTRLLNELLETLEMMGNCSSCKDEIGKYHYFNKFN